jgi:dTDP-4-dehydrorhamnose 3,5-epimerase
VCLLTPEAHDDARGFFVEMWDERVYRGIGISLPFVQDGHSRSARGTIRGLHYQIRQPQGKLVWVAVGEVFDVAVDLRRSSPAFGKWVGTTLSGENHRQLWIPPGCAHGYYVTSESADVMYKLTDYYTPEHERTLRWDDPDIGITWPLDGVPLVSNRDHDGPSLSVAEAYD